MKIVDSSIQMSSSRVAEERHERRESLTLWRDGQEPREVAAVSGREGAERLAASLQVQSVQVTISTQARALQPAKAVVVDHGEEPDLMEDLEFSLLKLLVERFTGREIKLTRPCDAEGEAAQCDGEVAAPESGQPPPEREGWGMVYDYYESHYEAESTSFSSAGVVKTADGKEIGISLELNMSREFFTEQSINIRAGDALKDPLVINFDGTAAQLTQREFSFDIDADGRSDQIAFVQPGSGFLALDINGDGEINDGSELFGPRTGNGFEELAAYDLDGNQWIDENDAVYEGLRIWSKDADGNDQLVALGERGVGAIYLGRIETPFLLKDSANETLGAVRESGIYLQEEGGVGTVQRLDLVV
jgi:hypothetical protein